MTTKSNDLFGVELRYGSTNNTFYDIESSANYQAVDLEEFSTYNTFTNITVNNNQYGFGILDSSNNSFINITTNSNTYWGFAVSQSTSSCVLENFRSDGDGLYGLYLNTTPVDNIIINPNIISDTSRKNILGDIIAIILAGTREKSYNMVKIYQDQK